MQLLRAGPEAALPYVEGYRGAAFPVDHTLQPLPRRSSSLTAPRRRAAFVALTPSMEKIADRDLVVELNGFPTPLAFRVGGNLGNVVTRSFVPSVHRGWRIVAVDGQRLPASKVSAALHAAQKRQRYSVTFSVMSADVDEDVGDGWSVEHARVDVEDDEEGRRLEADEAHCRAMALEAERLQLEAAKIREAQEAGHRRKEEEAREAERLRRVAEEVERQRKEAEEAERQRKQAEEAERKRKEAEEAERQRREAQEAERRRREAEEAEQRRREEEQREALRQQQEEAQREAERQRQEALRLQEAERLQREAEEAELKKRDEEKRREAERAEQRRRRAEGDTKLSAHAEMLRKEAERRLREAEERRRRDAKAAAERAQLEAEEAERGRLEA